MNSFSLILFAVYAFFVLSIGILISKKGLWQGIVGMCSTFLAIPFALRWDVQCGNILTPLKDNTAASFFAVLVLGSLVFGLLTSKQVDLKYYFHKKNDKFITIALLLLMALVGVVLIQAVSKYPIPKAASIPVIGSITDNGGEKSGFKADLTSFNTKLGGIDGAKKPYGIYSASQKWFSIPLQLSLILVLWLWAQTGAWAGQDLAARPELPKQTLWKILFALVYPLALLTGILVPIYIVDALIPLLLFIPLALIYVKVRNTNLPYEKKVLTKDHIASLFKKSFSSKKKKGKRVVPEMTIIDLSAYGKSFAKDVLKERTENARSTPGYSIFGKIVNNALLRRATMIEIEFNGQNISFKYFIDGLWHPINNLFKRSLSVNESKNLLASMRAILGDNSYLQLAAQKNSKQNNAPIIKIPPKAAGQFFIEYDKRGGKKKKMLARLALQLKGEGETAVIQFERIAIRFGSYEKMRVGQKRGEQIKQLMATPQGLIVFAAPPGQGLRTFTDVSLSETDRFTRDAATVEDIKHPYMPIENLPLTTYDSSKGETPDTVLPGVFFKEPKLLLLRDLVNKETFQLCCDEIKNERMIITTLRAKTSAQAIMMLLRTGIDPKVLADSLTAVITQRLIRTLCPSCKEEIPATDEICRKLGIPPGKIKTLYRRRVHAEPEPGKRDLYVPCNDCMEIGYKGLAGLYDIIVINDEIRQVMTTHPSEDAFRRAARSSGGGSFMVDGSRMVAEGMTSVEELSRVLKL